MLMQLTGFKGKTALVTGAGGGMGLAIARALAAAGSRVVMVDLKEAPTALPAGAIHAQGDVSDDGFVAGVVGRALAETGRLDFLVNAAGVLWFGRDRSLVEMDLETWNRVLAINLTSMVLTARHAVPQMKRVGGGAMVHVSSVQALRGDDRPQDAYQAAKAAMIALSKSLAIQFAGDRIRSNALLPGPTESPMQARWSADPEMRRRTAAYVPLGRVGTTEDMANACLFLLSDQASYITGTELIVDGGLMAKP